MELADRAAALYALPLDDFVAARNAGAKDASQGGDKALAAALRKLPKPTSAAWLVNLLATRRRDEVQQVLELAASLEEAQASLDRAQLHALGRQRQRLIADVARQSLEVAAEVGNAVGPAALPAVEQTLRAALADPAAAAAVLTGRLVRTLEATGWEDVDLEGAVAGPFEAPAGSRHASGADSDDEPAERRPRTTSAAERRPRASSAAERRRAEATLRTAQDATRSAQDEAARVERAAQRLDVRREGLTASIEDLEDRLAALRRELGDLEDQAAANLDRQQAAQESLDAAERTERTARAALADPERE